MKKLILAAMVMSVSGGVMADGENQVLTDTFNAPDVCQFTIGNDNNNDNAFGESFALELNKSAIITATAPVATHTVGGVTAYDDLKVVKTGTEGLPKSAMDNGDTINFVSDKIKALDDGEVVTVTATITADCQ